MLFKIKEKVFSLKNQFTISDERNRPMFKVIGKVFSASNKLSFQEMSGQELALIQKVVFSWRPRYQILTQNVVYAEIEKKFAFLKSRFAITVPHGDSLEVEGRAFHHEFSLRRQGREVATVSKKRFSWGDSYGVEIPDGEDVLLVLCTCIVIDQILHNGNSN